MTLYKQFMTGLNLILKPPPAGYYAESDGDSHRKTYYVCHTQELRTRIDCFSMREARQLARRLNNP